MYGLRIKQEKKYTVVYVVFHTLHIFGGQQPEKWIKKT